MAKRANREGSTKQRSDGRWEARYLDADGKRHSLYGKTQAEVVRQLRSVLQQIEQGEYCPPDQITVASWLETWWTTYCEPVTRKNSSATSKYTIFKHLVPALGSVRLQHLRPEHIQSFVNQLIRDDYAPATVRRIIATLRTALKQAVVNNILIRNPAENLKLPKMNQREIDHLTADEQRRLLDVLPINTYGRCLRFILGTGLRASEAIGLRWQDLQQHCFTVSQAITEYRDYAAENGGAKTKHSVAPPKSAAASRSIPLTRSMQLLLSEQRESQRIEKQDILAKGIGYRPSDLVFAAPQGQPLDRHNLARTLRASLIKAGLEPRGIHALRHTFATNAVQSGMDFRTLTEIIGHSRVAFTLQTYAHSDMDTKLKALEAMEAGLV